MLVQKNIEHRRRWRGHVRRLEIGAISFLVRVIIARWKPASWAGQRLAHAHAADARKALAAELDCALVCRALVDLHGLEVGGELGNLRVTQHGGVGVVGAGGCSEIEPSRYPRSRFCLRKHITGGGYVVVVVIRIKVPDDLKLLQIAHAEDALSLDLCFG